MNFYSTGQKNLVRSNSDDILEKIKNKIVSKHKVNLFLFEKILLLQSTPMYVKELYMQRVKGCFPF